MIMFESGQLRKVNLDGSKVKTRMVSRTKTGGHKPEGPKNQKLGGHFGKKWKFLQHFFK